MKLYTLGDSDLRVSPIGLGCWQFSKGSSLMGRYWPELPDEIIRAIVKTSLDGGVNWFDTAESYGWGASESALAAALSSLGKTSEEVIVATKWWPAFRTALSIGKTIHKRLDRLRGLRIDLYQVHQPFGFSSVESEMDAMARLVERKNIRYVGVSNFNAGRMRRADAQLRRHGLRLVSNQVRYNLLHRSIESNGVLEAATELGITIIAYSPLAQGILTGKFHDDPEALGRIRGIRRHLPEFSRRSLRRTLPLIRVLRNVASAHGVTAAQVALRWLIAFHGERVVAIPGATSPVQAQANAGAMDFVLSLDEMKVIERAAS